MSAHTHETDDTLPDAIDREGYCKLHDADTVEEAHRKANGLPPRQDAEYVDPETLGPQPATDYADPHDIIPQSFMDAYPEADTVAEALSLAEQAPPADGHESMPQCPRCSGVRLSPKSNGTQEHRRTDGYVCETCGTHVSDPDNPETADIEFSDGQVQLGRWTDE